ncbi:MAG: hypothetical protein K2M48_06265 [Clostridiales bacterium]|nr:hypothetical protein [Clostridiales bacterium]
MKIDYQKTIDALKENGLILPDDKCAVCLFIVESKNYGLYTETITSKVDYIIAANADEIKLFDIDKKTGEYLESMLTFRKDDIQYTKKRRERNFIWASKGIFGGRNIAIRFLSENFAHDYLIPKKYRGYEQLEARAELFEFIKSVYNPHYDALKKAYKGK